ncbi:hypothetical protein KRM28CT15_69330 [Krasilnikovia sp. M28-CT-15]
MGTHHEEGPEPEEQPEHELSRFERFQPTLVALAELATAVVSLLAALKGSGLV